MIPSWWGDANFAAASLAKNGTLIRADGICAKALAEAILTLMPLDTWAQSSVTVMGMPDENGKLVPLDICGDVLTIVRRMEQQAADSCQIVDRFEFYKAARSAYAVVAAGESGRYGCYLFQKGVL